MIARKLPSLRSFGVVMGAVGETGERLATDKPNVVTLRYTCLGGAGKIIKDGKEGVYDYFDYQVTYDETFLNRPESYEGVSGGAVWRVYANSDNTIETTNIVGVAFWQTEPDLNGNRVLICHGPDSVYGKLHDEILATL